MRQDQFIVTAVFGGTSYGQWDKCTGGNVTAQDTKYRPGGAGTEVSLGGMQTVENVTVSKLFTREQGISMVRTLQNKVGRIRVTVSKQALDDNGVPYGSPFIYSGTLSKITCPDADSSSNSAALVEAEISCDGTVG